MRFSKLFKSAVAGIASLAMVASMMPLYNLSVVNAAVTDSNMLLHWDMTGADGKLTDLTGNNHDGVTNGSVSKTQIDNIDVLDMTGGYVDIPDGTIPTTADAVTVNMLVKISENIPASWMFCLGSSNKRYLYFTGCCSSGQGSVMRGGVGCVPTEILEKGNGWDYEAAFNGDAALKENEWQNVTITYKDNGEMIFYRNGEKVASKAIEIKYNEQNYLFTLQDLMTAGDERDGYMGWSLYTEKDPKFKGKVADFRIYDGEMTAEEVKALNTTMDNMLSGLASSDFSAENVDLKNTDCLGTNTDPNAITENLVLPPKTTPMRVEKATLMPMAGKLMATGISIIREISSAMPMPVATPMMPPRLVSTAASVRNCIRIRRFLAPMAFFRPISAVRSVTETSMMFMTPMPPTSREMLAIQTSWALVAWLIFCSCWACSSMSWLR